MDMCNREPELRVHDEIQLPHWYQLPSILNGSLRTYLRLFDYQMPFQFYHSSDFLQIFLQQLPNQRIHMRPSLELFHNNDLVELP